MALIQNTMKRLIFCECLELFKEMTVGILGHWKSCQTVLILTTQSVLNGPFYQRRRTFESQYFVGKKLFEFMDK